MGPIRNPKWSTSGMRVTLSYLPDQYCSSAVLTRIINVCNLFAPSAIVGTLIGIINILILIIINVTIVGSLNNTSKLI